MDKILQNIGSATDPVAKGLINIQQKTRIVEDIFEQLKPIDPTSVKNAEYQKMVGVLRSLCREKTGSECFFVAEVQ